MSELLTENSPMEVIDAVDLKAEVAENVPSGEKEMMEEIASPEPEEVEDEEVEEKA